ncbi:TfoX/Sxy family protein [Labrys monachus]|uniref:DNA transformation protein n=1 Tax=Labrys monachus TaxID=217067 RepID=A0ABU0FHH0_9HYPH|nr:TfoX/Sxy family protein [Labrys monachus]MDQ0393797.1 DNA transformation protein [Labrys monachus]
MDPDHLRDLFAGLPQLSIRRLFGGVGLYSEGRVFALGAFEQIWIKADAQTIPLFQQAGSAPFTYQGRTRTVTLPYWSLPDEALDDPEQALKWARLGLAASRRAFEAGPRQRRARALRSTS